MNVGTLKIAAHCVTLEIDRHLDQIDPADWNDQVYEDDLRQALAELSKEQRATEQGGN